MFFHFFLLFSSSFFGHHFENCLVCHLVFQKLVLWNFLIFKTGTLGCFCFSKGIISQTWDFWGTKAAKSTSFEGKKVPKYQFLKYQVAYQAVFKMMSKKKKKNRKNMKKMKKQYKKKLILLFLRTRPTRELAKLIYLIYLYNLIYPI